MQQIKALLGLGQDRNRSSAEVKRVAQEHIQDLETRIREMEEMKKTLETLTHHCHGDERPDCPILEDLAGR